MDNEYSSIAPLLMGLIAALSKRVRGRFGAAGLDLTPDQFALLDTLARHEAQLTQSDLADILDKDKSVLMRQTDQLEEQGLVTRTVSPEDRRRKTLSLTAEGQRLHAKSRALIDDLMRELCGDIPLQRLQGLLKSLELMRERAQSSEHRQLQGKNEHA